MFRKIVFLFCLLHIVHLALASYPTVVTTWAYSEAAARAWTEVTNGASAVDAVTAGVSVCESLQCGQTVGWGGSPDESGETTLDAMIFNGTTMEMGAVAGLKRVRNAIGVAKAVMDRTKHSILAGSSATDFALSMNFENETLSSKISDDMYQSWKKGSQCQPNYWKDNVSPDSKSRCGPYSPAHHEVSKEGLIRAPIDEFNHDTIGMIVLDQRGHIAAGTSSNGVKYKIPGRIGDAAIPGAGAYADSTVGAAVTTGDGDIMMRFLPSFFIVEQMRKGESPMAATKFAMDRIAAIYPDFRGAAVALNIKGQVGAACRNLPGGEFPVMLLSPDFSGDTPYPFPCVKV